MEGFSKGAVSGLYDHRDILVKGFSKEAVRGLYDH